VSGLSPLGGGAEFVGAGDEVVVVTEGRVTARGVLADVAADGITASVRTITGRWLDVPLARVAHPDSPMAEAAARDK
jgi:hypothetical protein